MQMQTSRSSIIFLIIAASLIFLSQCGMEANQEPEEDTGILQATNTRPLRDFSFEPTAARIKRGEYLTNGILMCFHCHSPKDTSLPGFPPVASRKGSGSILWDMPGERMVAPNITPDKETGAGTWTDDMLARAIREGIGHDGRALSLPMYWGSFRELSDEDLASVVVYLRSIPAVKNKLPKRRLSPEAEKNLQGSSLPLLRQVSAPDLGNELARGRYLIKLADCAGCHTGWYKRNPGFFGGGNRLNRWFDTTHIFSTNITPDTTGIYGWTPELFTQVIRTGKNLTLDPVMPWTSYLNMTDEDLRAMLLALQKLPPVQHRVINTMEATFCEVCEQSHGYGQYNKIVPLREVAFDKQQYPEFAGTYVHRDGFSISVSVGNNELLISEGGPKFKLVHTGGGRFQASGLGTPVSFKRDSAGKVKWIISYWIEDDLFEKQSPTASR